jgi:hypothetical protein
VKSYKSKKTSDEVHHSLIESVNDSANLFSSSAETGLKTKETLQSELYQLEDLHESGFIQVFYPFSSSLLPSLLQTKFGKGCCMVEESI